MRERRVRQNEEVVVDLETDFGRDGEEGGLGGRFADC